MSGKEKGLFRNVTEALIETHGDFHKSKFLEACEVLFGLSLICVATGDVFLTAAGGALTLDGIVGFLGVYEIIHNSKR